MIKFLKRLRTPWYVSSIISAISFFVLAAAILVISEIAGPLLDPRWEQRTAGLGGLEIIYLSAFLALLFSSFESYLLAKDRKRLSVALTWLLIGAITITLLYSPLAS